MVFFCTWNNAIYEQKYELTFIPKFHILAVRGEKTCILTIFGRISAILEDFLIEKENITQKAKVASRQYAWGAWPLFFNFQSGILQNGRNASKKWSK